MNAIVSANSQKERGLLKYNTSFLALVKGGILLFIYATNFGQTRAVRNPLGRISSAAFLAFPHSS